MRCRGAIVSYCRDVPLLLEGVRSNIRDTCHGMRDQTFSCFTNSVAGCGIIIAHSLFILFIIAEIHNIYI